jgi:hypothetical protein
MNSITGLTPKALRRAADLQERILALQAELNDILGAPAPAAPVAAPEPPKPRKRRMSAKGLANIRAGVAKRMARQGKAPSTAAAGDGAMTVKTAILKALASGKPMDKKSIAAGVSMYRGKKTLPTSINPTLHEMKVKDKTITNPSRGLYKLK